MNQPDIDKAYISPYDQLLYTFDQTHPPSASQREEIEKHKHIAACRDDPNATSPESLLWPAF